MPTDILMPALSPTMEEGKLAKWLVKEGDEVASGDVIAEIETDKATMEVEAVDEGRIGKILVDEGTENVKVNVPIAVLLGEDEDASSIESSDSRSEASQDRTTNGAETDDNKEAVKDAKPEEREKPADSEDADGADRAESDQETRVPATPKHKPAPSDSEIPEGTELVSTTVRDALRDAMAEEMRRDQTVFVIGEEVAEYQGAYKVTQGLLEEFGDKRVIDTPITEHGFAGVGVGAAFGGMRPVVEFMTFNFAMQAMDHIINSAAKTLYMSGGQMGCPIVFRGPNGPASRVAAQHSQDYSAWYSHIPGLKVIAPYSAADAKGLLKSAIRDPNPVICLENEILYGRSSDVPKMDEWLVPLGKAKVLREGSDVTLVSFANGLTYTLAAAEALAEEGISAEVLDLRSLRPMDTATIIESVKKTNRLVTVEEGWSICGVGAEIAAVVMVEAFDHLDAPVRRVSGKDVPMPYAANLEKLALPSSKDVVAAAKSVLYI